VLALATQPGYTFLWRGDEVDRATRDVAGDALYALARDSIGDMRDDPGMPYDTGALDESLRLAPVGYNQDDTALFVRDENGFSAYQAARLAPAGPTDLAPQARSVVSETTDGLAVWVGSWVYYAFWVHQGYYNVWLGGFLRGRFYIAPFAERRGRQFGAYFDARWRQRYGEVVA
jgi:hypothetical protein